MVSISTQYPHLYVNAMINTWIDKTIIHVQCNRCRSFKIMFFIQIIYYSTHNQCKVATDDTCVSTRQPHYLTPDHIEIKKYVAANN